MVPDGPARAGRGVLRRYSAPGNNVKCQVMKHKMINPFLVGKHVYLRPHIEKDLPEWSSWFNDPEVTRYLEQAYFPNTLVAQTRRLESLYRDRSSLQLAIVDRRSGALVGTVGLHQINLFNRNADVSIVVGNKAFWGKGLGQEAVALLVGHGFEKLNLHKITAGMVAVNRASLKLFLGLGFRKEALIREQLYIGGQYQDMILVAALKRRWSGGRTSAA